MALTRAQKETQVAEVQASVSQAMSVVFVAYDALDVDSSEELRDQLFEQGARIRVMPKRLLRLVLQQAKLEFDPTTEVGQVALAWGSDAVSPAKVLHTFAGTHKNVRLLAGILEGKLLSLTEVQHLATLPSRQELLGQLVGTLAGPIRGLQTVLTGTQRNLVYALSAVAKQKSTAA